MRFAATAVQVTGSVALTCAAFLVSVALGLFVAGLFVLLFGVAMELR